LSDKAKQPALVPNADDERLWRQVLAQIIPKIYGMYLRKGVNQSLAEELTQKTVFDAVKGRSTFDPQKGELGGWMMAIGKNNLAMEMRKRANLPPHTTIEQCLAVIDGQLLPDEVLEQKETAALVVKGLGEILENEKDVLEAKYVEDLSARQIAGRMKISEKAVHSLLYRARNSLREKLRRLAPHVEGQAK
jgi:RNA polymerase sigma-70 factor (ECF subfamily)